MVYFFVNVFCVFVVNRKCLLDFLAWIGSWALTGLFSLVVSIVCLFLHLFLNLDPSMDVQLRSWFEQTTHSFSCPARVRTACWGYNSSMILMSFNFDLSNLPRGGHLPLITFFFEYEMIVRVQKALLSNGDQHQHGESKRNGTEQLRLQLEAV